MKYKEQEQRSPFPPRMLFNIFFPSYNNLHEFCFEKKIYAWEKSLCFWPNTRDTREQVTALRELLAFQARPKFVRLVNKQREAAVQESTQKKVSNAYSVWCLR